MASSTRFTLCQGLQSANRQPCLQSKRTPELHSRLAQCSTTRVSSVQVALNRSACRLHPLQRCKPAALPRQIGCCGNSGRAQDSVHAGPSAVVQLVLDVAASRNGRWGEDLVSVLSDDILDRALAYAQQSADETGKEGMPHGKVKIKLQHCLHSSLLHHMAGKAPHPFFDSFARRAILHTGIEIYQALSAMSLDTEDGKKGHVHRYLVHLYPSMEKMILTFHTVQQDTVRAAYKGMQASQVWVLTKVTGEWREEDLQDKPSYAMGPEAALHVQLRSLQAGHTEVVRRFAAEQSSLAQTLSSEDAGLPPDLQPLLNHASHHALVHEHERPEVYVCLLWVSEHKDVLFTDAAATEAIGVAPFGGVAAPEPREGTHIFAWTLTKQRGDWLTESIERK